MGPRVKLFNHLFISSPLPPVEAAPVRLQSVALRASRSGMEHPEVEVAVQKDRRGRQ